MLGDVLIVGGGFMVLIKLNNMVSVLKLDVEAMKTKIMKMTEVLMQQAVFNTRLTAVAWGSVAHLRRGDPRFAGHIPTGLLRDAHQAEVMTVRPCMSNPMKHKHNYPVYDSGLFYARKSA